MTTRVLVTGAAGLVGSLLRPRLARPGRILRLLDTTPLQPGAGEEVVTASVTDQPAMLAACRDVAAVVHLAGLSGEAPWPDIVAVNIDGTRTLLEAARQTGVDRVVLASSNHAVGYVPRGATPLPADVAPRPDTYYGVSKVVMEALGSLYADRFGMRVTSLRIGTCREEPTDERALATWLSPDDAARLVEACLATSRTGHRIVWGVSANARRWWSLAEGEELGYHPVSDAEPYAGLVTATEPAYLRVVGGAFTDVPLGER